MLNGGASVSKSNARLRFALLLDSDMSTSEIGSTSQDHEEGVHFSPPLYRQRYAFVLDYVAGDPTLHSLLDVGCGTGQLLTAGKYRNPHIQLIAGIDLLRLELDEAYFRLKPLSVEYILFRRATPLHMYLLQGTSSRFHRIILSLSPFLQVMRPSVALVFIISMWSPWSK